MFPPLIRVNSCSAVHSETNFGGVITPYAKKGWFLTMKKKFVLATTAIVLAVSVLTACADVNAASVQVLQSAPEMNAHSPQSAQPSTEATDFAAPDITVSQAVWQYDEIPVGVISPEEAAQIGAQYLWDVFGKCIDGMHVVMLYSDCWLRPSAGRWTGIVYPTQEASESNVWWFEAGAGVVTPVDPDANTADRRFNFTIDSATGERLETASHSNTPVAPIFHDTQVLWESARGREIQAMNDNQLAAFIGLSPEQLEVYFQQVTAFAEAHFNNSTLQSVELGRNIVSPYRSERIQGIQPLLDTDENGNIFGTLSGIEFTATDHTGREAVITMSIRADSISIW